MHLANRRRFLTMAGVAGLGGIGLAGCAVPAAPLTPVAAAADSHSMSSTTPGAQPLTGTDAKTSNDEMDAMHEAGVKKFLAGIGKNPDFWGKPLSPQMDGDTKVFELTASDIQWTVNEGNTVDAMAYNERVPGPLIRVTEGDKVRIKVTNKLKESHAMHLHGLLLPNAMDGVPFITQPPIKPGGSFDYVFTVRNSGSHMYHSHHNAAHQTARGLLGPFIVMPKDSSKEPAFDSDYVLVLNDILGGYTLNGRGFPETQPIVAKLGERVRIRYMNEGIMIHPMHLHGLEQLVIAKDGWPLPQPYRCDTLNIAPGERWDVIVNAHTPGAWAFHCHILTHAESAMGMFGMVTAMVVA